MDQIQDGGSPGSDNPDAMAALVLNQLESDLSHAPQNPDHDPESGAAMAQEVQSSVPQVVVPPVYNPSEYPYLPGHFTVHRIVSITSDDPERASYTVKLKSGERMKVSHS